MYLVSEKVLALLGYITVQNEEMHSRQIKWIDIIIKKYDIETYNNIIYDVINDKTDKVALNVALEYFENESIENKSSIYIICYQLALLDNDMLDDKGLDSQENKFLLSLIRLMNSANVQKLKSVAKNEIQTYKKVIFSAKDFDRFDLDFRLLQKVSLEDFVHISDAVKDLDSNCDLLYRQLTNHLREVSNPQLSEYLNDFLNSYNSDVLDILHTLKKSIPQKELASRNFSLALMGRTKAGKSTLHAVMCGEGDEFIGKGSQRTTRFNRVFSWNGLKIIDTPGIGAGEADGEKDTDIAQRVIPQADIICFVVNDDTISEEVLKMLDNIAEYHKPLVIILNHKENIQLKSHLKKFVADPYSWKDTTGEQRLAGWIERLNRNAEAHGYKEIMHVIPVFLLAALKGMREHNSDFINASNYPYFIDTIKVLLKNNCIIYKSQTMLDEPSLRLHKSLISLNVEKEKLSLYYEKIQKIQNRTVKKLLTVQKELGFQLAKFIDCEYEDFYTLYSEKYSEESFDLTTTFALQKEYEKIVVESGIKETIEAEIEKSVQTYRSEIAGIISDLEEEIRYAEINILESFSTDNSLYLKKQHKIIPVKGIIKSVSMVLDVVAAFYPALMVISVPLSFVSSFFKTKNQKMNDAKLKAKENFRILVDWQKKETLKVIKDSIYHTITDDEKKVEHFFQNLLEQTSSSVDYIEQCSILFKENLKLVDTYYGIRLLEFITENAEIYDFTNENVVVYRHPELHSLEIRTKYGDCFNTYKIRHITGEKVRVKKWK